MEWKCSFCNKEHDDLPLCYGMSAPWQMLVDPSEFAERVSLDLDTCVLDGRVFFMRGHIEIPIIGNKEPFAYSVWCSLSEKSFKSVIEKWFDPRREYEEPSFGWLSSHIPVYPETLNLKTSVQTRAVGIVPLITLEPTEHLLAMEQRHGISKQRWHELAINLLK